MFHPKLMRHLSKSKLPSVATPLGTVIFHAFLSGEMLRAHEGEAFEVGTDACIHRWETSDFEAEFLLGRPKVPPMLQGRIDDSWAGIWRVRARNTLSQCSFFCRWQDGHTWHTSGPDSGQGLDAQSFTDDDVEVVIGTEDCEYVSIRADRNEFMPRRLKPEDPYNFAEYLPDGFNITISDLLQREVCQFQFLVAWGPGSEDVGPWMAVDRDYRDILKDFHIV